MRPGRLPSEHRWAVAMCIKAVAQGYKEFNSLLKWYDGKTKVPVIDYMTHNDKRIAVMKADLNEVDKLEHVTKPYMETYLNTVDAE
jgi:hypothetical protein